MKKIITIGLLSLSSILCAQKTIIPGSSDIKPSYLKPEKSVFNIFYVKKEQWDNKGKIAKDLSLDANNIINTYNYTDENNKWYRKRVTKASAKTFAPISFNSESTTKVYDINFGENVTGKIHTKDRSNKDSSINIPIKDQFIEYFMFEELLRSLPLTVGYKATIPCFYYNIDDPGKPVTNYVIKEVKSYIYNSPKTGAHDTWLLGVLEESTGAIYYYIVDKKDHRLWQREMPVGDGVWEICINDELDYQPIKNKFNKDEAMAKIQNGNSSIIGTAFARDRSSKLAVLNMNKAQYAPKGTVVSLLLNSPYIEEWKEVNKQIRKRKKLPEVPIDPNVAACIKTTKVYDDKGHFEFTNLQPGEYLVMTTFGYTHRYLYSYYAGENVTMHASGAVLGSTPVYGTASASTGATADIEQKVTIEKDGDKVEVKLKDTM